MAKKRGNSKLSYARIVQLRDVYRWALTEWAAADDHEELLFAHASDLLHKLNVMVAKDQGEYLLKLSVTEAIAFVGFWKVVPVPEDAYSKNILRTQTERFHKMITDQRSMVKHV